MTKRLKKSRRLTLSQEIEKRSMDFQGQGDGIFIVMIRLDEIISAVRAFRSKKCKRRHREQD